MAIEWGKILPEGACMAGELSSFLGRNLLIAPMDRSENVIKMNKLAGITEMVISLNKHFHFSFGVHNIGDIQGIGLLLTFSVNP